MSRPSFPTHLGKSTTMEMFLLWHVHKFPDGEEDAKLIGVYSSRELAEEAQQRAVMQPGFRDRPSDFCISGYTVNQDHWQEGYVTETHADVIRQWQENNTQAGAAPDGPK